MNLIWLEDFLALAAIGNFSRTAEDRHSSQPAFSRRIRALEERVGADLFDRSTQPAKLTEVGEWFRGVAEELVEAIVRVPGEVKRVAEASSATLRIASTHALSFTFLPQWLRSVESSTALGPVNVMSDVLERCEALMMQSKVQFVLCHAHPKAQGPLDADAYRSTQIGNDVLLALSRPDERGKPLHQLKSEKDPRAHHVRFPARGRTQSSSGGVAGAEPPNVPVLDYTEESGLGRIMRAVFGRRLERSPAQVVFTAHLASVLRTMALDGRGLAWLPQTLVQDDISQGRLVMAADADWNISLEIRLYRQRSRVGKRAEEFWSAAAAS